MDGKELLYTLLCNVEYSVKDENECCVGVASMTDCTLGKRRFNTSAMKLQIANAPFFAQALTRGSSC